MSDTTDEAETPERQRDSFGEILRTVAYALAIALVFRTLLFQPFSIPSGSMKSTLLIGDYLFVSKYAYGYSRYSLPFGSRLPDWLSGRLLFADPERGDVIVFRSPADPREDIIKRLIGLPGDLIEVRESVLFINGVEVVQTPIDDFVEAFAPAGTPPRGVPRCTADSQRPDDCRKRRFQVELRVDPDGYDLSDPQAPYDGEVVVHAVLDVGDFGAPDPNGGPCQRIDPENFGPVVVPDGHYFFMGDNRDNSSDSRRPVECGGLGFVPAENLVGRAEFILMSSGAVLGEIWQVWNWRSDRYFRSIQ